MTQTRNLIHSYPIINICQIPLILMPYEKYSLDIKNMNI